MFDEQKVQRDADGKFSAKEGSRPEDVVLTTRPELDAYWSDVAHAYALTSEEQDWLAEHLATVDQSEWTTATTSRNIIADAMRPHVKSFEERAHDAYTRFSAAVGAEMYYDKMVNDELALVVKKGDYLAVGNMEGFMHYIGQESYPTAASIPAERRSAKRIATAIEENDSTYAEAYSAQFTADAYGERLRAFER